MTVALIFYSAISGAVAAGATGAYLSASDNRNKDAARRAARVALTCWAWPLYALRFIIRMANDARGGTS